MQDQKGLRGKFKALFKKEKVVSIATIVARIGLDVSTSIPALLRGWKLESFFDVHPPNVVRNDKPMPWERTKDVLKKLGKQALVRGVPIAIGVLTGGTGLGLALGPIINGIVGKLKGSGLLVPDGIASTITDVVRGKTDDAVKNLVNKIVESNPGRTKDGSSNVADTIKLVLGEELFPVVSEIKAAIGTLAQQKGDLQDIFEDWMDEQRDALEKVQSSQSGLQDSIDQGFRFTKDQLTRMEDEIGGQLIQLGTKLEAVVIGQAQTTAMLTRMEKGMEAFLKEVCAGDVSGRSLDEWFKISRVQFQQTILAGKYDAPFDSTLFVETPTLDMTLQSFVSQTGHSRPLFLLLANMGMGKTWNVVYTGRILQQTRLAIPFFIPLHLGYEDVLGSIFNARGAGLVQKIGDTCQQVYDALGVKILLILDGLDELPVDRQNFLNFLEQLLHRNDQHVLILLTDRVTDWIQHERMQYFYNKIDSHVYPDQDMEPVQLSLGLQNKLSAYLDGFTDEQLARSIERYGLDAVEFESKPGLVTLCKRPYVLRLVKDKGFYPDPEDP
nr:hypothetical protein [Candidatus Sigynarchaeota archaeon]